LVTRAPIVVAPAMHTEMWEHPSTVENVAVLRERGLTVLEPADGRLTGPDSGPGRLPEPEAILDAARAAIAAPRDGRGAVRRDLVGRELLITAGGTREDLDPVRFLANHSSGRQGWALAHAALVRGARVRLAAANVELVTPPGARRLDVGSAAELADLVAAHRGEVDALVMAAAVADFTAAERAGAKIKKDESAGDDSEAVPAIALRRTQDILRHSVLERTGSGAARPAIVGFAAETGAEGTAPSSSRSRRRAARARTCWSSTTSPAECSARPRTPYGSWTAAARSSPGPRAPRPSSPAPSSTSSCPPCQKYPERHDHQLAAHLLVRIGHRRAPRQDLRPDRRRHPRRPAGTGPRRAGGGGDDGHHRTRARRRRGPHQRV